ERWFRPDAAGCVQRQCRTHGPATCGECPTQADSHYRPDRSGWIQSRQRQRSPSRRCLEPRAPGLSAGLRLQCRQPRPEVRLRVARPQLLWKLLYGARLWICLAAVRLRQLDDWLGSLRFWRMDLLSRLRVLVCFAIPVGMAAVSLRLMGLLRRRYRMGVDSRRELWKRLVWQWISCRSSCGKGAFWLDRRCSSAGDVGSICEADRHGWQSHFNGIHPRRAPTAC